MTEINGDALDRYITGNYGEDQLVTNHDVCPYCGQDIRQRADGECCCNCLASEQEMKEHWGDK